MENNDNLDATTLYIKLGTACNSHCLFCAIVGSKVGPRQSTSEVMDRLDIGRKFHAGVLSLSGGEPTIREDLLEIIKHATDIGYQFIQVQTNARRLSNLAFVRTLVGAGVSRFIVPLHGHQPMLHDSQTQVEGSFQETLAGIQNIVFVSGCDSILGNLVITKINYLRIDEILTLYEQLGVRNVLLTFIQPDGSAKINADALIPRMIDVKDCLVDAIKRHTPNMSLNVSEMPECIIPELRRIIRNPFYDPVVQLGKIREYDVFNVLGGHSDETETEVISYPAVIRIEKDCSIVLDDDMANDLVKGSLCSKCRQYLACPGIRKQYAQMYGFGELHPLANLQERYT